MTFVIIENVRGYFGSRPPLVAFMIFLAAMAVGLITFAYFVSDMPRAVVDQEHARFVDGLSRLSLCVGGEERGSGGSALPPGASQAGPTPVDRLSDVEWMRQQQQAAEGQGMAELQEEAAAASPVTVPPSSSSSSSLSPGSFVMNVTMWVTVEVMATAVFQGITGAYNTTVITTTLSASQLGRAGFGGQDLEANASLVLPPLGNRSHPCLHGQQGAQCYRVRACLTLTAPRHFFPQTQRPDISSDICQRGGDVELWGENHLHGDAAHLAWGRCVHNASLVRLQHVDIANHRAVIFIPDRSAVNLHLMHSSYFLFVMVISLFCYAIIKGRPAKIKVVHTQSSADKHMLIQA